MRGRHIIQGLSPGETSRRPRLVQALDDARKLGLEGRIVGDEILGAELLHRESWTRLAKSRHGVLRLFVVPRPGVRRGKIDKRIRDIRTGSDGLVAPFDSQLPAPEQVVGAAERPLPPRKAAAVRVEAQGGFQIRVTPSSLRPRYCFQNPASAWASALLRS